MLWGVAYFHVGCAVMSGIRPSTGSDPEYLKTSLSTGTCLSTAYFLCAVSPVPVHLGFCPMRKLMRASGVGTGIGGNPCCQCGVPLVDAVERKAGIRCVHVRVAAEAVLVGLGVAALAGQSGQVPGGMHRIGANQVLVAPFTGGRCGDRVTVAAGCRVGSAFAVHLGLAVAEGTSLFVTVGVELPGSGQSGRPAGEPHSRDCCATVNGPLLP